MGVVTEMKTIEVIPNRGNHSADSSIIGGLCTKNPRSPTIIRFIRHSICYADYAGRREQGYRNSSSGQLIYYPLYCTVNL